MCFNQPMSGMFSVLAILIAVLTHRATQNNRLTAGVVWFALMEGLQFFQYYWIDDCDSIINKTLTWLGFFHICLQPFFTHLMTSTLVTSDEDKYKYKAVLGLSVAVAVWMLFKSFLAPWATDDITKCPSTEWLRGENLCTLSGKYHLAWSVPMHPPTYFVPSAATHSFAMFAPFLLFGHKIFIIGAILFFSGPVLASYITPSLLEQASIWCFFSIAQILVMFGVYVNAFGLPRHLLKRGFFSFMRKRRPRTDAASGSSNSRSSTSSSNGHSKPKAH